MSTYTSIASQTLASAASSITFSSIPQGYTDLVVVANVQGQSNGCNIEIWFNGDNSASNYSSTTLYYAGASAASTRNSNTSKLNFGTNGGQPFSNANQFAFNSYNVQNYSNTTTYKTVLGATRSPDGGYTGAGELDQAVGVWRSTAAINSISIGVDNSKTMQAGSTFSIYGIAAGDFTTQAAGGDITVSGGYAYHVFKTSGLFTPYQTLTTDILVVGGGGGGGKNVGAGGGAGGLQTFASQSLTASDYQVLVGAGGVGGGPSDVNGFSGSTSALVSLTPSLGGGGGGGAAIAQGLVGGSGGGSSYPGTNLAGGLGVAGQGNNGGSSVYFVAGGGGGAGAAGANATGSGAGAGGIGGTSALINTLAAATSTGVYSAPNYYFAGGGGGGGYIPQTDGAGGIGGGGAGGGTPTAGTANTGGGGGGNAGGSGYGPIGASGGSGIVIIRYAV